jgi:hypothetical protein
MQWTRVTATDERLNARTAKSCGPVAPTLASSARGASFSGVKVARKPGHLGEREVSRKPLRRESRRRSGSPVVLPPVLFLLHGTRGCDRHPAFPAPSASREGRKSCKARAHRAARMPACILYCCLTCESEIPARHCEERKRRSNPCLSKRRDRLLRGAYHRTALRAELLARNDAAESTRTPNTQLHEIVFFSSGCPFITWG